jgi:hypothetical protein
MGLRLDLRLLLRRTLPIVTAGLLVITTALNSVQAASNHLGTANPELQGTVVELKGTVDKRPTGTPPPLLGDWTVAGQNLSVTNQTIFLGFGDAGPQLGACVEVAYYQASPTTRIAVSIAPDNDCAAAGAPTRLEWKGKIDTRPEQGANGTWSIGKKAFEISDATFFEGFGSTRPIANACVEVSYEVTNSLNVALRIRPDDTCNGPSSDHSFRGPVDSRPSANVGDWVIGGRSFAVTAATAFAQSFGTGQPAIGDCVGLTYSDSATTAVRTVATIFPANCAGDPPGPSIFEANGIVDANGVPNPAPFGTWSIGGVSYSAHDVVPGTPAVPATAFDEKFGKLIAGACAQVHYQINGTTRVAVRIETEPSFRCTRSAEEHELYGQIKKLPGTTGQLGTWSIGDLVVVVTPETQLAGGPFALDQLVSVKFVRAGDGSLLATSIKVKRGSDSEKEIRNRGKAYGVISALPSTPPAGAWIIGSTSYTGTVKTRLPSGYVPAVGDCAEVYFQTDAAGARTALKISPAGANDCKDVTNTEQDRVFGSVAVMPTSGYVGSWTVAGVVYSATATTVFATEHGPLAVGAFVEVRYVKLPNGSLEATQIRTIVPPGAGEHNHAGKLEIPTTPKSLDAATAVATASWVIGGTSYQVNADTQLNDSLSAIQNGATVLVNAYIDAAGNLIATQVTAVTNSYVPLVAR